jgi:transcriptional regulator with XRE-family HTH domain
MKGVSMGLAEKLISLRKQQDWTQATAAKTIDIQQSYLSKLENGRHFPSPEVIDKLCSAYNITSKDLLSTQEKVTITKQNIVLVVLLTISMSLVLSGYLALFFPQTYYTYKAVPVENRQNNLLLNIQLTDQYLGERYLTNIADNDYEYVLIAQQKISRIENRWLIAIGALITSLILFIFFYKFIRSNKSASF